MFKFLSLTGTQDTIVHEGGSNPNHHNNKLETKKRKDVSLARLRGTVGGEPDSDE